MKEKKFEELEEGDCIKLTLKYRDVSMQVYRDGSHYLDGIFKLHGEGKYGFVLLPYDLSEKEVKERFATIRESGGTGSLSLEKEENGIGIFLYDVADDWTHFWVSDENCILVIEDEEELKTIKPNCVVCGEKIEDEVYKIPTKDEKDEREVCKKCKQRYDKGEEPSKPPEDEIIF